jgi:hypothetical protein
VTNLIFGERTGYLDPLDYDLGVAASLGALHDEEKNQLYLPLTDPCGKSIYIQPEGSDAPEPITRALVVFKQSEPTHTEWDLPAVLIQRDDVTFTEQREWSPTLQYRLPAEGSTPISIGDRVGYDCYETKEKEWPHDFTYTIECWARHRVAAQILWTMVMRTFPPRTTVTVRDGRGVERVYHAFTEGTADLTEINSLVDRVIGYSLTLRIEGELTLDRVERVGKSFTGETRPPDGGGGVGPGDPSGPYDPDNPDPGDGGLYGEGLPCRRVTMYGSDE